MTETVVAVRVMVADDDVNARSILVERLEMLGHHIVAQVGTGRDAVAYAIAESPDVVLLDVHMPDGSGIDAAKQITAALPGTAVVLFTGDDTVSLTDSEISETSAVSLLPKGTPTKMLDTALRAAAHRARALKAALSDATSARQDLENRKLIERAKGLLMRRTGCTEQEAYRILQRTSQDKSVPMVMVARTVIDSEPGHGPASGHARPSA